MQTRRSKILRRILVYGVPAAILLCIWACKAPSFPLPPPDRESITVDLGSEPTDGLINLEGAPMTVPAEVEVRVINIDQNFGMWFYSNPDGSFSSPDIPAELGERMRFYYMDDGDSSYPICFLVEEGANPPPCY